MNRRDFLKRSLATSALALSANSILAKENEEKLKLGKAKSIIQVWLWGGPAQLETFDPKPKAGADYSGNLTSPIATDTDGLFLCQLLPKLAKMSQDYSVIRSMSHGTNAHETASYLVQTGRMPDKDVYPAIGAMISKFKGYEAGYTQALPPYIVLTKPQGRFSENGFLPAKFKPFATGGDPTKTPFEVEGIVARGLTAERQRNRKDLLEDLNMYKKAMRDNPSLAESNMSVDQAYEMILGDTGKVFDTSQEDAKVKERYGKSKTGQSCLVARRLVEAGVPYITLNLGGWDTHKLHFEEMAKKLPELDSAVSSLIADLKDRGLLDTTIVWVGGEFGRTPKLSVNAPFSGGRGHHGDAFSCLVAGGGIKGGTVVGTTDEKANKVASRPTHPADFIATLYNRMGIDPYSTIKNPRDEDVMLMEKIADRNLSEGILREII
ncbi:MAG: DUF1501 domain-containing protein [Opitutales bacterium]